MGEFQAWFRVDADCLDYLDWLRWPDGFVCPECGHARAWELADGRYECSECHERSSVTAGTIFDRTRTPLTVWFTACWLFASQKDGISALALKRALEIGSNQTAWAMLHRLRSVLVRPGRERLQGDVEVDETFIGGEEPGLRGGRQTGKKVLVGVAVKRQQPTGFGRCRMAPIAERARQHHPHAKRGLLVPLGAWTDEQSAEAIVDSMALGRIDYYVPRPGASPDEVFHQAVSSFLLEWATDRRIVPHTVHIVGEEWSGRAYELREVFERCAVPHAFCLAESEEGRELVAKAGAAAKLPLMVLPDGKAVSDPSNAELAEAAGAPADLEEHAFDIVIVGAGPAGLSAAVYGASEGLRTLVVDEGGVGGQARSSSRIRNYLGFPKGVSGSRLAEQAYEQASVFGASFLFMHRVAALDRSGDGLELTLVDDRRITARAVILATGAATAAWAFPRSRP